MSGRQLLGVAAAFAGVLVMLSEGRWQTLVGFELNSGVLIALLAMCGFAGYAVNLFRLPHELSFLESLFGIIVMGSLALLPFYLIESFFVEAMPLNMKTLGVVFTLAMLVSVLGMLMWNFGNRRIGPGRAGVFINLIPVFGVILATIFLGGNHPCVPPCRCRVHCRGHSPGGENDARQARTLTDPACLRYALDNMPDRINRGAIP